MVSFMICIFTTIKKRKKENSPPSQERGKKNEYLLTNGLLQGLHAFPLTDDHVSYEVCQVC